MNILIIIGAGASYDCWPKHIPRPQDYHNYRLPLAKELFAPFHYQGTFLQQYDLLGIASQIRAKASSLGDKFDVEEELLNISQRAEKVNDDNTRYNLFKTRFYLQKLITTLNQSTIERTVGHTEYMDLIRKLKFWIEDSPDTRVVDIVTFNYDTLLEGAMENHYTVDWGSKNENDQMSAYYQGKNLRIYKPHGSINWGRVVHKHGNEFNYSDNLDAFRNFKNLTIQNTFTYIDPRHIFNNGVSKNVIPAIAVPFKEKTNFDECPQFMQEAMLKAINDADYIITLGWKGAEKHFTSLLSTNEKVKEVHVVSPTAETHLRSIFPAGKIHEIKSPFNYFISQTEALEGLLGSFNE